MTEEAVVDEAADAAATESSGEAESNDQRRNVYAELKRQLELVRDILEKGKQTIQPAVQTLAKLVPEINEMIDEIVKIIKMVKETIMNLDTAMIPIDDVRSFIDAAKALLGTAKELLPDKKEDIDTALDVVYIIDTIPTPEQLKQETEGLLDEVIGHLGDLKAA